MNNPFPIKTDFGILKGRDILFLDDVKIEYSDAKLSLIGEINGELLEDKKREDISYTLSFSGVLSYQMIELDSWNGEYASSFDEIKKSEWIRKLIGKTSASHQHYRVVTYDHVFDVVAVGHEWQYERNSKVI